MHYKYIYIYGYRISSGYSRGITIKICPMAVVAKNQRLPTRSGCATSSFQATAPPAKWDLKSMC